MKFKEKLIQIQQGDKKTLRKTLSSIADISSKEFSFLLNAYLNKKKVPWIFGLLGTPGSGKSTFLNQVVKQFDGETGLLLIDPANPSTGGSLLGDRIRLSEHFLNKNLFIRSISNDGGDSGLPYGFEKYLLLLSLYPFERIIIESVGGGQSAVSLKDFVHRVLLVFDPFSGDKIQHIKSGVLDIADVVLISKSEKKNTEVIKESLLESMSLQVDIHSFDVGKPLDAKNCDQIFSLKEDENNRDHFLESIVKRSVFSEVKKQFDEFTEAYFKKNKVTDKTIQELKNKFIKN